MELLWWYGMVSAGVGAGADVDTHQIPTPLLLSGLTGLGLHLVSRGQFDGEPVGSGQSFRVYNGPMLSRQSEEVLSDGIESLT